MGSCFVGVDPARFGMETNTLNGRTALITGGAQGIGREVAFIMARLGARVAVADISGEGQVVAEEILRQNGTACFFRTDVSEASQVVELHTQLGKTWGGVDILVNNAIISPVKPLLTMTVEEWDRVMAVNLTGPFLTIKHFLPGMLERDRGTIANMVSTPSMPYMAAYAGTKQALESLTHSLAGELEGSAVTVFAYGAGMVETPGGVEAFGRLAGYLGLSYTQMTESGFNPGYPGLIPPYDTALVLVYAILNAREYHNQTVAMHEVAERMIPGFAAVTAARVTVTGAPDSHWFNGIPVELLREVREAIRETDAEFDRLPFFVRPMARGGFRKKAHMTANDYDRFLATMAQACEAEPENLHSLLLSRERLVSGLPGLLQYYNEVPGEMAKFIRDHDELSKVADVCRTRAQICRRLLDELTNNP